MIVWADDEDRRIAVAAKDALKPQRALASMLDQFCEIARPGPRTFGRLAAFVDQYGPWGRCECGGHHGPLDQFMRPPGLPRPPGEHTEDPVDVWLSAHRLNALRAITASCRAGEMPDRGLLDALVVDPRRKSWRPRDYVVRLGSVTTPATAAELVDTWTAAWLRATHVTPALGSWSAEPSPVRLRVRGVAGALAVAFHAERLQKPQTAICDKCGITWTVFRGFVADEPQRCRSCEGRGTTRRPNAARRRA